VELTLVEEGGVGVMEGAPGQPFMTGIGDATRILEACFSNRVKGALLFADNLTPRFFDLSSREAGEILQKLRTYGVRLAAVCPPGSTRFSTRFDEMLAEERQKNYFGVFETREAARAWLNHEA
jgi:hypothetical protein